MGCSKQPALNGVRPMTTKITKIEFLTLLLGASVAVSAPISAFAESWAVNEYAMPSKMASADGVSKWCEVGGKKVRFSNTAVPGYEMCGGLAVRSICDAAGKKIFTRSETLPYGFRDCSEGPRIYIRRHEEPLPQYDNQPVATVPAPNEMPGAGPIVGNSLSSQNVAPFGAGQARQMRQPPTSAQDLMQTIIPMMERPDELKKYLDELEKDPKMRDALKSLRGKLR